MMKYVLIILLFSNQFSSCQKNNIKTMTIFSSNSDTAIKPFTYLALGDSYTIGHDVPAEESYPNQTISLLKKDGVIGQVKIIATTGWTTTDLKNAIANAQNSGTLLNRYDIVTLLIGVNNEYRGLPVTTYESEFEELLKNSILLTGKNAAHVIVLSIPDWSVTPFAAGKNTEKISKEIDQYNAINKTISERYGVAYLDITTWTREAASDLSLLADDRLHPSGKEYTRWAAVLKTLIREKISH